MCPDCNTLSMVMIEATLVHSSRMWCDKCKEYKSMDKWIEGNKDRVKRYKGLIE